MQYNSIMVRALTDTQLQELDKLRIPSTEQLNFFGNLCHFDSPFDPLKNEAHTAKLLAAVIKIKDCRLFHDDGVDEYFIYRYSSESESAAAPAGHRHKLSETVVEAALELWFPEVSNK